jgi:hypothetical protein
MNHVQVQQEAEPAQETVAPWVRERDDEMPVELWNEVTGEMARPLAKRSSARVQADAMVVAPYSALQEGAAVTHLTHLTHKVTRVRQRTNELAHRAPCFAVCPRGLSCAR